MAKVVIIGPAHPLRGGLATFNQRLAREFMAEGHSCEIYSFSLQYPRLLFPGRTQYTSEPAPAGLVIHSAINSVNPLSWLRVGRRLYRERPDLVVVRFWLPFMGPALGTILRRVKKNRHTRIVCIADNIVPHERRPGDRIFTRYFIRSCHAFITMSAKVQEDLAEFAPAAPSRVVQHPLYDNFGTPVTKAEARRHLGLPENNRIILFFGFIRNYKGLDLLLDAIGMLKQGGRDPNMRLLVAGEFYEKQQPYLDQIERLGISERVILRTEFIPDSHVRYYLSAADVVVQPYRHATQSGVTPLAYHFEKPMIVTNVGGLPALVPDHRVGLVVEPKAEAIAEGIRSFYQLGEHFFIPHLREEKKKYSWKNMVDAIFELAHQPLTAKA
ncbi:MAG TPA: glycosyltransferase [Chitinophagaceae bacterium]|nr:glycosyltransferase [Chitinophagaceae bacterium]